MQKNIFKRVLLSVLLVISAFVLVACSGTNSPTGSIPDTPYLTVGNNTISEKDLYLTLRLQGHQVLNTMVDEILLADKIAITKDYIQNGRDSSNDDFELYLDVLEWLDTLANNSIFGLNSSESISKMTANSKKIKVTTYVDSLYMADYSAVSDRNALVTEILNAVALWNYDSNKDESYIPVGYPAVVLEKFLVDIAKKLYAKDFLAADVLNEDSSVYFEDETDIVSYYKDNKKGQYDVKAFVVTFINKNEADSALRLFNLKSNSRGDWVVIPDIRTMSSESITANPYVSSILDDLGLNRSLNAPYYSEADYEKYYNQYSISTSRPNGADSVLPANEVLKLFVEMYNLATFSNTYAIDVDPSDSTTIDTSNVSLIPTNDLNQLTNPDNERVSKLFTYNDLETNTSLRSHLYTTLIVPKDSSSNDKQYSSRVQSFGNYTYLVYKTWDDSVLDEGILVDSEDEDGNEIEVFDKNEDGTLTEKAKAIYDEMKKELIDSKFTDTYVQEKVNELYEGKSLAIYDEVINVLYSHNYTTIAVTGGKSKNGTDVANIDGTAITVENLYDRLEKLYGINTAADLLFTLELKSRYQSEITDDDIKDYKQQYKNVMTQFSQNALESEGYPSSLGRKNFLIIAFGANNNNEALERMYIEPKLRELFFADLESHYGDGIYEKLALLSHNLYDSFKSININHLLVYVDADFDGNPDDPKEFFENKTPNEITEYRQLVASLSEKLLEVVGSYASTTTALQTLVEQFNGLGRYSPIAGRLVTPTDQFHNEFAIYRRYGLFLKYEELGSVTNETNLPSSTSSYDQKFYDRTMKIYELLNEYRDEKGEIDPAILPYLDLARDSITGGTITEDDILEIESSFGWHLILANSLTYASSASSALKDDSDKEYISNFTDLNDNKLVSYNNSDKLTASQIEIYVKESKSDYGVESLPSSVTTAINSYFSPIQTKYTGAQMQNELIYKEFELLNATWKTGHDVICNTYREINRHLITSYNDIFTKEENPYYYQQYGNWFEILEGSAVIAYDLELERETELTNELFLAKAKAVNAANETLTLTVDFSKVNKDVTGAYPITYSATDGTTTVTKTVTVYIVDSLDNNSTESTVPTITVTYPLNSDRYSISLLDASDNNKLSALFDQILAGATASDTTSGNLTNLIHMNTSFVNSAQEGTYIVLLTVYDRAGNKTTEAVTVEIF